MSANETKTRFAAAANRTEAVSSFVNTTDRGHGFEGRMRFAGWAKDSKAAAKAALEAEGFTVKMARASCHELMVDVVAA